MKLLIRKLLRDILSSKNNLIEIFMIALFGVMFSAQNILAVAVINKFLEVEKYGVGYRQIITFLYPILLLSVVLLISSSVFLYFRLFELLKKNKREIELLLNLGIDLRDILKCYFIFIGIIMSITGLVGVVICECFLDAYVWGNIEHIGRITTFIFVFAGLFITFLIVGYFAFAKVVGNNGTEELVGNNSVGFEKNEINSENIKKVITQI